MKWQKIFGGLQNQCSTVELRWHQTKKVGKSVPDRNRAYSTESFAILQKKTGAILKKPPPAGGRRWFAPLESSGHINTAA